MALLLACASAPTDRSKSEKIGLLLQKEIDWPYLKRKLISMAWRLFFEKPENLPHREGSREILNQLGSTLLPTRDVSA
jgi:hypothetical protein